MTVGRESASSSCSAGLAAAAGGGGTGAGAGAAGFDGGMFRSRSGIWPMAVAMQALTSTNDTEIATCLTYLTRSALATGFMHESFDKDDATHYTRPWFAWANAVFGELILQLAKERPYLIFSS